MILATVIIIGFGSLISIKLFNINIFPINIIWQNIIKRRIFDKEWDYEKVVNPDRSGYDLWIIGEEAEEISAAKIASGTVVSPVIFDHKELNMDYISGEDYYNKGGNVVFRDFIKKYYNNK